MPDKTGPRIREIRKDRGMTQEELAAKLGVTKGAVNKYETGIVVNLKRDTIEKIAEILDVSPADLMGWTDQSWGTIRKLARRPITSNPHKLRSIALLQAAHLSPEEDKEIATYIEFFLSKR